MASSRITVEAKIDGKTFSKFAVFDTFYHQKRWRSPLVFLLIMGAFSAVCFACSGRNSQAVLLGGVLLGVGLCLPAAYFLSYALSVRREAKKLGTGKGRIAYRVRLSRRGVEAAMGADESNYVEFPWESIYRAYRVRECIYLYRSADRAFLLPDPGRADAAWALIRRMLPEEKTRDLRRRGKG